MIKFNGKIIKQDTFGDGTLKCEAPGLLFNKGELEITWAYDNDSELFTLQCLVDYVKNIAPYRDIKLILPYIPNARQDRLVSGRLFTLKTFCKIINNMNFYSVEVYDPHSTVSTALLDRVIVKYFDCFQNDVDAILFPDAGAEKKYTENKVICQGKKILIGNKHRNEEGRIVDYTITNAGPMMFPQPIKSVLIKDDIVSYGGTPVAAAKALRKLGIEKIYLEITHCEANIFKGEVFDYIDGVYTTDSIIDPENKDYEGTSREKLEKLHVVKLFRGEE